MRILKFLGAFLAILIIIFFIVFGFQLDTIYLLFENRDGMQEGKEWIAKTSSLKNLTEYIGAQPEHVSIASLAVDKPDSSILYNEHTPRTMGRLSNIFLVIEYVRQIEEDNLDPDKPVPLSEVKLYQLPYIQASNHDDAISTLSNQGRVSDDGMVALSDLVRIAVEFNDLAASDYLLFSLGIDYVEQLMDRLDIAETEMVLPFSGLYISLNPYLYDTTFEQRMDSLSRLSRPEFENLVVRTSRRFINDLVFREQVIHHFDQNQGLGIKFTQERDALDIFPKTTALEMADLMKRIQQENLISISISQKIKEILAWPLNNSRLKRDFKTYGAIYDSRMGMVNGIDYGASSYSGEPFAQAVFFDNLQVAFWFHMSSHLMHQDFEQRLIWDPALREITERQTRE